MDSTAAIASSSQSTHLIISARGIVWNKMYSNSGYNTADSGPELTNNPFINDPSNPQTRFPDISGGSTSSSPAPQNSQYTSWLPGGGGLTTNLTGYSPQQYQQQQIPFQQQQQPLYNGAYSNGMQGLVPQPTNQLFQPSSSFGQQLVGQVNGSSYGYLQGVQTQAQPSYNPVQQQLQSPTYLAQFDPYASIGQGWEGQPNQSQSTMTSPTQSSFANSPTGHPHPREYIRQRKAELESWDTYAWKQMLGAFEALKDAWEARKKELGGMIGQLQTQLQYNTAGPYYASQIQQEGSRLQGVSSFHR